MNEEKKYSEQAIEDLLGCNTEQEYYDFRLRHSQFNKTSIQTLARCKRRFVQKSKGKDTEDAFFEYLSKGRTLAALEKEFKKTEKEIRQKLKKGQAGYELLVQRNEFGKEVFIFLPVIGKKWEPKKSPFERKTFYEFDSQPWVVASFPDSFDYKRIDLLPLSDIHYGHVACDLNKLREYIEYIRRTPNVITFLNGDLIENSSKLSVAGGVYEQEVTPDQQIQDVVALLRPIAHKILFSLPGNHEERAMKTVGIDVARIIAESLGVPYFSEPVHFDINWQGNTWRLHAQHGSSNSQTAGGRINAASKTVVFHDFHHAYFSGHVHNATVQPSTAIVRDYENMKVREKKYFLIIMPSFMMYNRTYASRMGWSPPSSGSINFRLFPNGDYHASA